MKQGQQITLPSLSYVNKLLIIISVATFVVDALLVKAGSFSLISLMGLVPAKVLSGHFHELFLYPFYNQQMMGIIFNSLLLWFLGSELEDIWGMKRYILFIFISYFGAGVVYLILGATVFSSIPTVAIPFVGLHGIASSLCMAYAVLFPNRIFSFMLIFPMKAKYFCLILIAMELYMGFISGALQSWGHLAAMFFAFGFMWSLTKPFMKNFVDAIGSNGARKVKIPKNSHLKIVKNEKNDDDVPPKYLQ